MFLNCLSLREIWCCSDPDTQSRFGVLHSLKMCAFKVFSPVIYNQLSMFLLCCLSYQISDASSELEAGQLLRVPLPSAPERHLYDAVAREPSQPVPFRALESPALVALGAAFRLHFAAASSSSSACISTRCCLARQSRPTPVERAHSAVVHCVLELCVLPLLVVVAAIIVTFKLVLLRTTAYV